MHQSVILLMEARHQSMSLELPQVPLFPQGTLFQNSFSELPVALSPVKSHLPSEPIKPSSTISPSKQKNAPSRPKKSSSTNPQSKPNKPPSTISPSKPKKPSCRKTHQSTNQEQNTRAKQLMLKKRQQKFKKCSPVDVIEVEGYTPKRAGKASKTWVKNHLFTLSREDKSILCSPSAWLSDTIIDAAKKFLKQKVPLQNGFQDICCGRTCAFDIESTEFNQILHNRHDHWQHFWDPRSRGICLQQSLPQCFLLREKADCCSTSNKAQNHHTEAHGCPDAIWNLRLWALCNRICHHSCTQ